MPKVPEINHKQIKTIYNPRDSKAPASLKQKNFIATLCERRELPIPDFKHMTMGEAAQLISNILNQ